VRILVAGGTGFLGSNLCSRLLDLGHEVIGLDNEQTSDPHNLGLLLSKPNFTYINQDIKIPLSISVDAIFNLACPASPRHYQRDPIDTFLTSIIGSKNLLDLAVKNSCLVLQASTSEIYGDPQVSPQSEEYWGNVNTFGIRSCYDEGKRGAETLFHDYHKSFGVNTRVARIFNTYGPNMALNDGRVVSNFIFQALNNLPLTVYGDGSQVRSFCYVSDLIDGLIKLLFAEGIYQPINLGNPQPITMIALANKIISLTSSRSVLIHERLPENDPATRIPQISKAVEFLDWNPEINLEYGLNLTIEYFRERIRKGFIES
jgi:UDP-glucuronate decarboxylase